jgi:hypothetical protein
LFWKCGDDESIEAIGINMSRYPHVSGIKSSALLDHVHVVLVKVVDIRVPLLKT